MIFWAALKRNANDKQPPENHNIHSIYIVDILE